MRGTNGLTRSRKRTVNNSRVSDGQVDVGIAAPLGGAEGRTATHDCGLTGRGARSIERPGDDEDGEEAVGVALSQRVDEKFVRARQASKGKVRARTLFSRTLSSHLISHASKVAALQHEIQTIPSHLGALARKGNLDVGFKQKP